MARLESSRLRLPAVLACAALFTPAASAQFGNAWLTLTPANNRIVNPDGTPATQLLNHTEEKDFDVGDLDQNGWDDLAVGIKKLNGFPGKFRNYLFMNESGKLVDRTAQYASASDVDQGFMTPTDTRDMRVLDLNGDGWLDVVYAQTDLIIETSSAAKRYTHPRVHINLGNDANGNWLGLLHEDARVPQIKANSNPAQNAVLRLCDTAFGDIDEDGDIDLYFNDYDNDENGHGEPAQFDSEDVLLANINNTAFFQNEAALRVPTSFFVTDGNEFGTEVKLVDLNMDGRLDLIKITTLATPDIRVAYNDAVPTTPPNGVGFFDVVQFINGQTPYTFDVADLNNDGRPDVAIGDDGTDSVMYNTGTDALGRVIWSSKKNLTWMTGSGDPGFPGQMYARDYDLDGWNDLLITDVDIDLQGCNRRTIMYHNRGGPIGSQSIPIVEEAQQAGSGGWKGVVGWSTSYPRGAMDAANIDIDNDGDLDIILGLCNGTDVWLNQTNPVFCQEVVQPASKGTASLSVCGAPLHTGLSSTLSVAGGPANGTVLLTVSLTHNPVPAFGGILGTFPILTAVALPLNGAGALNLPVPGGSGPVDVYLQALTVAPGGTVPSGMTEVIRLEMLD